jgi:gliding motility-associated lipoprotein GldD
MKAQRSLSIVDRFCKVVIGFGMVYALSAMAGSCNSPFTQKPKGYFEIPFPEKQYRVFDEAGYPYSFEYPVYSNIVRDSLFFGEATENPWWVNIEFPQFNGKIHVSYKQIGPNKLEKLLQDAFSLTSKHSQRAYSIDDSLMSTPNNVKGMFFRVGGDVATAYQFFLTDSVKHFLRGALYFDASPKEDSIGIVNEFVAQDMRHLINTFRWKNTKENTQLPPTTLNAPALPPASTVQKK